MRRTLILATCLAVALSAGCANLRPLLRPTGPDRAVKVLRGDNLVNATIFEGVVAAACQDFYVWTPEARSVVDNLAAALAEEEQVLGGSSGLRSAVAGIFAADELKTAEDHAETILDLAESLGAARSSVRSASIAVDELRAGEMLGGCSLAVLVPGEATPRSVICMVGEIRDKCRTFDALQTKVSFTGTDLRDGGGRYLPAGAAGIKGRPL